MNNTMLNLLFSSFVLSCQTPHNKKTEQTIGPSSTSSPIEDKKDPSQSYQTLAQKIVQASQDYISSKEAAQNPDSPITQSAKTLSQEDPAVLAQKLNSANFQDVVVDPTTQGINNPQISSSATKNSPPQEPSTLSIIGGSIAVLGAAALIGGCLTEKIAITDHEHSSKIRKVGLGVLASGIILASIGTTQSGQALGLNQDNENRTQIYIKTLNEIGIELEKLNQENMNLNLSAFCASEDFPAKSLSAIDAIRQIKLEINAGIKSIPKAVNGEKVINVITQSELGHTPQIVSKPGSRYPAIEDRWISQTGTSGIKYHAVYDGHGGPQVSENLRKNFHKFLEEYREVWQNNPKEISKLFLAFDKEARKLPGNYGTNAGSTAVMLIEIPNSPNLVVANLGDSPAVVVKKNGGVLRTIDHDPSNRSDQALIRKKGGVVQNGRVVKFVNGIPVGSLAVSRAFGDNDYKDHITAEPDVYTVPKVDVLFVALMSDGVGEALSDSGPKNSHGIAIRPKDSVEGVAQRLNDLFRGNPNQNVAQKSYEALASKGTDDITLMVIPFGD